MEVAKWHNSINNKQKKINNVLVDFFFANYYLNASLLWLIYMLCTWIKKFNFSSVFLLSSMLVSGSSNTTNNEDIWKHAGRIFIFHLSTVISLLLSMARLTSKLRLYLFQCITNTFDKLWCITIFVSIRTLLTFLQDFPVYYDE